MLTCLPMHIAFPLLGTDVMQRKQLLIVGKVTLCQWHQAAVSRYSAAVHLPPRMFAMEMFVGGTLSLLHRMLSRTS